MSDQLHKPLTGQYGFPVDTDRQATLSNLGFGTTAALAAAAVTKLALPTYTLNGAVSTASVTVDWSAARAASISIDSSVVPALTLVFANPTDKQFDLFIRVTGTPTITWPASIKWPGGAAPAVPATGHIGWYRFYYNTAITTYVGEGIVTLA